MSKRAMFQPTYRAEGFATGSGSVPILPINPCALDPAHELPVPPRRMFVSPPPRRSLPWRIVTAIGSLGGTIVAGAALMVLAQYLTMPR